LATLGSNHNKNKTKKRRKENNAEMNPTQGDEEWSEDEEDLHQPGTSVAIGPQEDITFASARYWVGKLF
jgi:hypothetical protein